MGSNPCSIYWIDIFTLIFSKNCSVCLKRTKIKWLVHLKTIKSTIFTEENNDCRYSFCYCCCWQGLSALKTAFHYDDLGSNVQFYMPKYGPKTTGRRAAAQVYCWLGCRSMSTVANLIKILCL